MATKTATEEDRAFWRAAQPGMSRNRPRPEENSTIDAPRRSDEHGVLAKVRDRIFRRRQS
jgi:hypothetical protein